MTKAKPQTTRIHLLRHGEVENPTGVLYGRLPDFHLSAAGAEMADCAAGALRGRDVVLVRSSPLERAQETAKPVAGEFGLALETDDRLIEPSNVFEGLTFGVGDGSLRNPGHWRHLRNPLRPSWGEPYADIARRVLAAVGEARIAAAGHEAVLVSHQLPIWVARRALEGRRLWHRPDRRQCALASLTTLVYRDDAVVAIEYREPAGLAGRQRAHGA
jgi:broad specificity phosphatase PhoE